MRNPVLLLVLYVSVMLWSGWAPHDRFTWVLEVAPAWVGLAAVAATWRRFPLSTVALWLLLAHVTVLCVGGRYTYAEVPLFDWIRDLTHGTRNNYDKVGHFMQGFVPAFVAREILVRNRVVASRAWIGFLVVCICIAISATYEWIEWAVAVWTGEGADAFLGTQGYVWDTQSDMLLAAIGALCALPLAGAHRRSIDSLDAKR